MIRPILVLVAETVLHDRGSNSVSAINIVEEINAAGYPLLIPRLTVLALVSREDGDPTTAQGQLTIRQGDETLFDSASDIDFGDGKLNRTMLQFQGFGLQQSGTLVFRFSVGDSYAESYPIPAAPAAGPPVPEPANLSETHRSIV